MLMFIIIIKFGVFLGRVFIIFILFEENPSLYYRKLKLFIYIYIYKYVYVYNYFIFITWGHLLKEGNDLMKYMQKN